LGNFPDFREKEQTSVACDEQENGVGDTEADVLTQPPGGVWCESSWRGIGGTFAISTKPTIAPWHEAEARSDEPACGELLGL